MTFYLDPKQEPEFVTISDENLKKMGAPPPKVEDMVKYLQQLSDQRFARARSTFEDAPPKSGSKV
ncbi:MAG: hypothetical protein IRZ16_22435 [Myxococcaceae bacterium]|nr:hypothetical protein [Myxococcaceae bacterium]